MTGVDTRSDQVARLEMFLRDWRRSRDADTIVGRLERFCAHAHPLFPATPVRHQPRHTNVGRLADLLPRLGPSLRGRRTSGAAINPWIVAGLARREVRNAAVLASLWSPMQCGEAGTQFLAEFLARVERPDWPLPSRDELAAGYVVRTEHCLGADGADRIDLVIESEHHLVGIEVKIDAVEGHRQLTRYVEALKRSAMRLGKQSHVVLLAPFPPAHADVLPSTWGVVRAAAEESLPERQSDRTFAHQLIAAFASHVRRF